MIVSKHGAGGRTAVMVARAIAAQSRSRPAETGTTWAHYHKTLPDRSKFRPVLSPSLSLSSLSLHTSPPLRQNTTTTALPVTLPTTPRPLLLKYNKKTRALSSSLLFPFFPRPVRSLLFLCLLSLPSEWILQALSSATGMSRVPGGFQI